MASAAVNHALQIRLTWRLQRFGISASLCQQLGNHAQCYSYHHAGKRIAHRHVDVHKDAVCRKPGQPYEQAGRIDCRLAAVPFQRSEERRVGKECRL